MNKEFSAEWEGPGTPSATAATHSTTRSSTAKNGAALPLKQIVTIRLDVDMLEWFRSGGPGYQTRINQILRSHMAAHSAAQQGAAPDEAAPLS